MATTAFESIPWASEKPREALPKFVVDIVPGIRSELNAVAIAVFAATVIGAAVAARRPARTP